MNRNTSCYGLVVVVATLAVSSVGAETPPAKAPVFESDVLPILNAHCLQCHGGVHQRNGLDLRSLDSLLKGGESGSPVVAGKPEESLLWKKLNTDAMPKTDNKVSAANKTIVKAWIVSGARGLDRKTDVGVTRKAMKPEEIAKAIDREVGRKLTATGIPASPKTEDGEFLRRVYLDITGKPPTFEQAVAFLDAKDPRKREKLIDQLLASESFGRNIAERWINLFYLGTVSQQPPSPEPFVGWMAKQLNDGQPWNAVMRDIVSSAGPLSESPQGLFYYYNGDMNGQFTPKIIAGNIGQMFLGVQIQCAECHNHPFSTWKQTDFWSVAAFFAQTTRMETVENNRTPGVKDRHLEEKKGKPQPPPKDISISIPNDGEARNGGKKVQAAFLDGSKLEADPGRNHRPPFADWLTSRNNRMFSRAAVNRFWAHFFGRGFVNPLNDFGDHNAPSHPELLESLTEEFVASDFDLKHLIRCICLSDTYQRTGKVVSGNEKSEAEALFARMLPKVLTPEQLYDALCVALEVQELAPPVDPKKKPNPKGPPPPAPRTVFAAAFRGPGEVDEPAEMKLGVPHALKLMNEQHFNKGGKVVERLTAKGTEIPSSDIIDGLFLSALARRPSAGEREKFAAFVDRQKSPREGYDRVLWVLINSSEFLLNR